jgi:hypothetical protein
MRIAKMIKYTIKYIISDYLIKSITDHIKKDMISDYPSGTQIPESKEVIIWMLSKEHTQVIHERCSDDMTNIWTA